ncbi:response regulator [Desulfobacterales bacterium HSG2]|nr:response regulator [Desulfobacterales bacterium HSG2]
MKMNIMVVDDNQDLATNLTDILQEAGYATAVAHDGKRAADLCHSRQFDLVIVDYKLPDTDGLQLQKRLSEIIRADYIIITAHASIESAARAVHRKEIVGYETKPLDMGRLLAFIQQVADRRQAEGDLQLALEESRRYAGETAALLKASRAVLEQSDFKCVARKILDICSESVGFTAGYVALVSENGIQKEVLFSESGERDRTVYPHLHTHSCGLEKEVCKSGKPVCENDFPGSQWAANLPESHAPLNNVMVMPLKIREKVVGVMGLANKPGPFTRSDLRLAEGFCEFASIALNNAMTLESLEKAREDAESASRAKTRFLNNMSHEIRTPMNAIMGFSHILMDQRETSFLSDEYRQFLENIHASGEHLMTLISDILEISRIEAGKIELFEEEINLGDLMKGIATVYDPQAVRQGVRLSYAVDPGLPGSICSDRGKLTQIIINLLGNAIKFTPARKEVRLKMLKEENSLVIRVTDQGIGIPHDKQEVIFDPFEQADNSNTRQHGGTGLGLAITRRLAEFMEGTISLVSEEGTGTRVSVILPLKETEGCASVPSPVREEDIRPGVHSFSKASMILVIEDEWFNQKLIEALLKKMQMEVTIADDGESGVRKAMEMKAEGQPPDLIFMDIQLPGMNGMETTRQIRRDPDFKETPIVALSEDAFMEQQREAYDAGLTDYVTKPLSLAKFAAVLKKYLR